jgi:hypothetical protein
MHAKDLDRADAIALAATKGDFQRWCEEGAERLCDQFEEEFTRRFCAEAALRQAKRCPHLYTAEDLRFWQSEYRWSDVEMFHLSYELGVLMFEYFLPMRLRRWRNARRKDLSQEVNNYE